MDYPWAFLFVVKVLPNLSLRQKFTDSFIVMIERQDASKNITTMATQQERAELHPAFTTVLQLRENR